jgi:hypothetical protein
MAVVTPPYKPIRPYVDALEAYFKVETPIHDSIRELITWECKEME